MSAYHEKLERLMAGTLDPGGFGHAEHVGVACEALIRHDFFHAAAHVATGLRGMAERAGAAGRFNATITFAFMSLIAERMAAAEYRCAEDFIRQNPDLCRSGTLTPWYSPARLASPSARAVALLPDRRPAG